MTGSERDIIGIALKKEAVRDYLQNAKSYTQKLMLAIYRRDITKVRKAIADGAIIVLPEWCKRTDNIVDVISYTQALMLAVNRRAREAVYAGAVIKQPDWYRKGESVLDTVIGEYDPINPTICDTIAKLLVTTVGHQSRNLYNAAGQTPLHLASGWGNKRLMRLLIKNGADVNAQDNRGNTPLHYAYNQRTVDLLLQNRADISIENHQGEVPISALVVKAK